MRAFRAHTGSVKAVAPTRAARRTPFASAGRDGRLCVWDVRAPGPPAACLDARAARRAPAEGGARRSGACYLQGGGLLATAGATDGAAKVWDPRGPGAPLAVLGPHASPRGRVFGGHLRGHGRAGTRLLVAGFDSVARVYDAARLAAQGTLPVAELRGAHLASYYTKACLSPDGRAVLTGDSRATVARSGWTRRPAAAAPLAGHTDEVTCVAWSHGWEWLGGVHRGRRLHAARLTRR